ncbi:MAG: hypothetical protein CR982_10285 [Candidatus Cloacimonadota bacterium]|nr:MAG: hypothetical protein CR982_10285 [Candidatus Cloacimonadota bacterium]PIE78793.1 MAG: hypothetical protein CSA15_05970 [Candidatus Delongbacteria bacterium]
MKAADILGLERVLEEVSKYALSERTKTLIMDIDLTLNLDVIKSDLDLTDEMKKVITKESDLPFDRVPEIYNDLKALRSEGQLVSTKFIYGVGVVLKLASSIYTFFYERSDIYRDLGEISSELEIFEDIEALIVKSVDEEGYVLDSASSELKSIRSKIKVTENRIRSKVKTVFDSYKYAGYCQNEELTIRDGRFVIPVKSQNRSKVKGVVRDESSTGNTLFIEPLESIEMNGELTRLYKDEHREIERIVRDISTQIFPFKNEIYTNVDLLTEFDTLYAKARYALKYRCSKVNVNSDNILNIYDGYHPILLMRHGYESTIPLNLEIGESYNTLIISGPNAGGKTVTMKTIGLMALMIRAGIQVPAREDSNIALFRRIFVDIGDEQSIENDLSTFSSQIKKLSKTLRVREKETLILLDEIGASTDPAEGSALSMAMLKEYTKRGFISVATTHQGVLKSFAHRNKGVKNGSMEFDRKTLSPTYRFRGGVPGSSYAFEISKRHGLPRYIIERAKKHLGEEKKNMENLISDLDSKITEYNRNLREVTATKNELKALKESYDKKYTDIKTKEKKILRDATKQGKEIISQANRSIENAIYEIKKSNAEKSVVKGIRKEIVTVSDKLDKSIDKFSSSSNKKNLPTPKAGMEVRVKNIGGWCLVNSVDRSGKKVSVSAGSLVMSIKVKDIIDLREAEDRSSISIDINMSEKSPFMGLKLDVRGKRGDDALMEVERYIDNLKQHNISKAEIVHGKGEGILGKIIQEQLSRTHGVKKFYFGRAGEGDYGVTIVELKDD